MQKVRGLLTLVLVLGGVGYFLYSQSGEKAFNGYILQARPWLEKSDATLNQFAAWLKRSEIVDESAPDGAEQKAAPEADLAPIVEAYRGVVQGLHAIPCEDPEIKPMKAQLDLYGSKRLEFLEQFQAWVLDPEGQSPPDQQLVAASDGGLVEFQRLRAAYFTKYNLLEETK